MLFNQTDTNFKLNYHNESRRRKTTPSVRPTPQVQHTGAPADPHPHLAQHVSDVTITCIATAHQQHVPKETEGRIEHNHWSLLFNIQIVTMHYVFLYLSHPLHPHKKAINGQMYSKLMVR